MKKLSDENITEMIANEFHPDSDAVRRDVRTQLKLSQRIPPQPAPAPAHTVLDLHQHTEQQAWDKIMQIATSGVRSATIITGASGILRIKFDTWARDSLLSPYIQSYAPINNGSFSVKFRKQKS